LVPGWEDHRLRVQKRDFLRTRGEIVLKDFVMIWVAAVLTVTAMRLRRIE